MSQLANQLTIPRTPLAALAWEASGTVVAEASDAFVGEVDRDTQPCLFHKPALYLVQRLHMLGIGERIL